MINFDDFDLDETPKTEYKILNYVYKHSYNDEYSYNGYRYCLYDENGLIYLGYGKWRGSMTEIKISDDEKDLILKNKIFITTDYISGYSSFRFWYLNDLISELKRYSPEFIDYVMTH